MNKVPTILLIVIILGIISWFTFLLTRVNLQVLNPKGIIASDESDLIIISMAIMLSVAIPIVAGAFLIVWKYRAGNKKSSHKPESTGSKIVVFTYWLFISELIIIFFFIVYTSSHKLHPYRPIESSVAPITIQVVALDWKWLFIYPEQGIATVNFIQIPVNTPINFKLTADGPMNSFWIPSLGGQIYSMAGMETKINLMADTLGDFPGEAAEINGKGFSGMRFVTRSSTREDFDSWVEKVRVNSIPLTFENYEELAKPSENTPVMYFYPVKPTLYNSIMMKGMEPTPIRENMEMEENVH